MRLWVAPDVMNMDRFFWSRIRHPYAFAIRQFQGYLIAVVVVYIEYSYLKNLRDGRI